MTKFAPRETLKSIKWGKLTFDERVVLHRVAPLFDSRLGFRVQGFRLETT